MSFEQTPEPAPLAPPVGAPGAAPVYRQDEFVRRPTSWTRPMQLAVAAYMVLSVLYGLATEIIFSSDYKALAVKSVAKSFQQSGRAFTQADVDQAVAIGVTVALVFGVVFTVIFVALAILSVTGLRTWVFWVDLVLLAIGIFGVIGSVTALTDPANAQVPAAARPGSLLFSIADLVLLVWMIVGLAKFGPWAQEKVPAAL